VAVVRWNAGARGEAQGWHAGRSEEAEHGAEHRRSLVGGNGRVGVVEMQAKATEISATGAHPSGGTLANLRSMTVPTIHLHLFCR
jgi:hypothetical protein